MDIKKKVIRYVNQLPEIVRPTKMAAYCRVSTLQKIQHRSLEIQQAYFRKSIQEKRSWIFVGVYADEASGRNNRKMKNFQRMMHDCREGKIDLIMVKSVSRLGRNTVQFLSACSELNMLGIDAAHDTATNHLRESVPKRESGKKQ